MWATSELWLITFLLGIMIYIGVWDYVERIENRAVHITESTEFITLHDHTINQTS